MMNSMCELQLEAKRLRERNEHLLLQVQCILMVTCIVHVHVYIQLHYCIVCALQMESSEENMRQLQSENNELLSKIRK